jgi:hypothetical protein
VPALVNRQSATTHAVAVVFVIPISRIEKLTAAVAYRLIAGRVAVGAFVVLAPTE